MNSSEAFASQLPAALATSPKVRISRDEMNLAEFPLTVLSTRANSQIKTLEFSDTLRGKNGEVINRKWIITGADKFGLPTSSDDEVILGLLKLTVDDGFNDRKIYFTRYELLRILRWTTEGRSYSRLQKALDRLSGVRIKATNAFYDNESKSHSTRNFGLIDAYEINDGRDTAPKPSFFIWSETLFKSFQVGFIKKLDLEFYLGLQSAVSKRLYRYLDKHFWYRGKIQINLFILAHEKIGISRNYVYASSIRQQLDPAVEELIKRGFVSHCEYVGRGNDTEVILYAAASAPRSQMATGQNSSILSSGDTAGEGAGSGTQTESTLVSKTQLGISSNKEIRFDSDSGEPASLYARVVSLLEGRGIKSNQVIKLLAEQNQTSLERIVAIVEHFDSLVAGGSHLVSRSPVGFLYRAVENPQAFVLPSEVTRKNFQPKLFNNDEVISGRSKAPQSRPRVMSKPRDEESAATTEYLIARKREVKRIREEIEPTLLLKVHHEVQSALQKLQGLISRERFEEAVSHGVDEKLVKLFAMPEFDEWLKNGKDIRVDI